jgi:proline iminopeptidase
MHGGLGLDHASLRPWHDPLGAVAELIYYDHRGNGRSGRPANLDDVDHETWVADADALRAHLGHERVVLLGHSYGAFLALEYALRHPHRLAGLILCAGAAAVNYGDAIVAGAQARATPEQMAVYLQTLSAPAANDVALSDAWRAFLPMYFSHADPEICAAMLRDTVFSAEASNRSLRDCLPHFDVRDRLGEITTPTLILAGRHDFVCPVSPAAELLHRGIAGSTLVVFEESAHFPFIEEQDRYLGVVREWLAALA